MAEKDLAPQPLNKSLQQKIDEAAKSLDIAQGGRTVVRLGATDNPKRKTLELLSGEWDTRKPWFIVDETGKIHALTSIDAFMQFIHSIHTVSGENFSLKLEKAIWRNFPVDFNDVWAVAIGELDLRLAENSDTKILEVDIESLVERIRREHPNLFYHIKEEAIESGAA
ncbi:MAG: DUF2603 domain-containing protein [Helicobacteraceae bacterium]|jgi:hypothetical protein|nr:DUF2603 domain-containing protein [Helicobacteraceae bacterium]